MKEKIRLTGEKETLLTPLYSKAIESMRKTPILVDEKAGEILERIDYDFSAVHIPRGTKITLCIRAAKMDDVCREFLAAHPESVILHPGCGLDSRFCRVDNGRVEWYDLDFEEVIALRRKFYPETERYHMIASPVTDLTWLNKIDAKGRPVLVVCEGLSMYLSEEENVRLLKTLREVFPGCKILFDAYSRLTVRQIKKHPTIKKTGAVIRWGIDNPEELENLVPGLKLKEEWFFAQYEHKERLDRLSQILLPVAASFRLARIAHRILIYE